MKAVLVYLNNDKLISRGVGYVLQAARTAGHEVDLIDTAWVGHSEMLNAVVEGGYKIVLISSTSLYWPRAASTAQTLKWLCKVPIVLGGVHATVVGGRLLDECSAIDYLCIGEGEEFIVDLLNKLEAGKSVTGVKNLVYRDEKGQIQANVVRPCTDLNTLPQFDYKAWNPKSVIRDSGNLFPGFCYVSATRGCPYSCSYCCNSYFLKLYHKKFLRTYPVDIVIAELRYLRDNYPLRLAYFGDEMILFNRKYVVELFTRVREEVGVPYGCMFRTEAVDRNLVNLLCRTGCQYVAVGIECGDKSFRRQYLNRRGTNQQIIKAFSLLREIPGVWITTYNMRGFPVSFDDRLTTSTQKLNQKLRPDHSQMTWFYPIPGTRLYDYCIKRDLIDQEKLNQTENYFQQSVLKWPIPSSLDKPLY